MIEVQHLTKRYGPFTAVDDISFTVDKGEILGFLGPNGAGKTTTMRVLTGYMPPTEGTAIVAGYSLADKPVEAKPEANRQGEAFDRDREKKGELELCKEKAQGLDGPDRARFMTDCLKGPGRT